MSSPPAARSGSVAVVGDAIIDALVGDDGQVTEVAGGAALNVAVGLAVLGRPVCQIAAVGLDRRGAWLRGYLRDRGVQLICTRTVDPTGVAWSRRVGGEPVYSFNGSMLRRRVRIDHRAAGALADAAAVVLTSLPLDSEAQVDDLLGPLSSSRGLVVVDPNPRPALMTDPAAFRDGFHAVAERADVVKVSDEDLHLLYGCDPGEAVERLRRVTSATILLTRGGLGAVLDRPGKPPIAVPAAVAAADVVDTLGAGDSTVAVVTDGLLALGPQAPERDLEALLRSAMRVAGETALHPGGLLRLPRG